VTDYCPVSAVIPETGRKRRWVGYRRISAERQWLHMWLR